MGKEHPEYAASVNNLASMYREIGDFDQAELFYLEARDIYQKTFGVEHPEYASCLFNLGVLNRDMGRYEVADSLLQKSTNILEKVLGKDNLDYALCLNNQAILYMEMGNYEKSELLFLQTKTIREKLLGKEHPDYARCLHDLANLYRYTGNYVKAEMLFLEAITIQEIILGKDHSDYVQSINSLAILYWDLKNYAKAESNYLEAKDIRERIMGKENHHYAAILNNLALLYWDKGEYQKAEPLFMEAKVIREKVLGKDHPSYANSLISLAGMNSRIRNYEKARQFYLESKEIRTKALGAKHPAYAQNLKDLAMLCWATGDFEAAKPLLLEAGTVEKSLLTNAVRYQSELEKSAYLLKFDALLNQTYSFALQEPNISYTCYDNNLFYKGFLLNAAAQINTLALSDLTTSELYSSLKSYQRRLAKEYAKPIPERKNIPELEEKANTLEKELTRTVAGFGEALRQVSWQEVQSALKPNEAALEFIRYNYYTPEPTDSIMYAALLLKPGMEAPAFIPLFEEKQLQAILAPLAGQGSDGLNELYAGQSGQSLYQLLWKPLEPSLQGTKAVYMSPAGLLHRLNLSAIPTAPTSTETIGKRHELYVVGSTRQLVVSSDQPASSHTADAVVFGGIQYEMDSTAIAPVQAEEANTRNRGMSFNQTDSTLRGDTWRYLKYSEKEAVNVQTQLQKAGFQAEVYKGFAATEESFKQIGKDKPSPQILHLSTHGFFFPDVKNQPKAQRFGADEPVFKISDNPMIRAGLILAGGNYAWKAGKSLGNREDGILTAYEISQMDLRNTDLVVLSACETGLGQIEGNEGVYGLQRAFKIAGAKHLIMSLWQIPDFHTQELMTAFYSNMLAKKMPIREALSAAQETMRLKRYEPFYWAGFVLVE